MREREHEPDEPRLFDLRLDSEADEGPELETSPEQAPAPEPPPAPSSPRHRSEPSELPLFAAQAAADEPADPRGPPRPAAPRAETHRWTEPVEGPRPVPSAGGPVAVPEPARGPRPAPFRPRLIAALADLGVYLLVLVVGLLGALMAGAAPTLSKAPAFALFLLSFSFLYGVVSLAFWGQTPGMAAAGVVARGGGDQPLTFGQTGLRWVAGVLTAALLGLPLLLALSGRSLADRLSGSRTLLVG